LAIQSLRKEGETVINGFDGENVFREELNCNRRLESIKGEYKVVEWQL